MGQNCSPCDRIVLSFSPPPFGLTTRKRRRLHFSNYELTNAKTLCLNINEYNSSLSERCKYTKAGLCYLGLWAPKATKPPPQSTTAASEEGLTTPSYQATYLRTLVPKIIYPCRSFVIDNSTTNVYATNTLAYATLPTASNSIYTHKQEQQLRSGPEKSTTSGENHFKKLTNKQEKSKIQQ